MGKQANIEKQLRAYRKEYERIKARVLRIGFICKGSLIERRLPCGNPNCSCHKDPKKRHGPYYQLSWKEKGKTVSHFLPRKMVRLYRQWSDNRRKLMDIIAEMEAFSRKVGDSIRTTDNRKNKASLNRKKTRKKTR
jgi:hypothetical protein